MKLKTITFLICAFAVFTVAVRGQQSDRDLGISLYREGKYDQAVERLSAATKNNKKDRVAWIYLGSSYVHLNKYSDAQKSFGKTNFVQKDPGPAYDIPLKIISKPRAPLNDTTRRNNTSGTIRVAVELLSDGKIGFIFPLQNFLPEWEPEVVAAAKRIRFEPAVLGGVPVTVVSIVEYSFTRY